MSNKIALDLKKFKHVKSDDNTTTLQHKDGHILTIAKKALSPEFQKQLSALSRVATDAQTPLQKAESKMAEGGEASEDPSYRYAGHPKQVEPSKPMPSADYKDKTSPEQDTQRRKQNDADDAAFRKSNAAPKDTSEEGYKTYAEGGKVKKNYKLMGSHGSKEGLEQLASKHFYSPISIKENENGEHEVHNSKGKIEGLRATNSKNRWKLEREELAQGGVVPQYAEGDVIEPQTRARSPQFTAIPDDTPDSQAQMNQDINKEVESADSFVNRTENPSYVPPVKEIPADAVPEEKLDPAIQEKRKIYNQLVGSNPRAKTAPSSMFGSDGSEPVNFDPTNWARAEEQYANQQGENAAQIAGAQQQAAQINKTRTAAGLPPIPVPNIPEGPQIPGSMGNPPPNTPPNKILNPSSAADMTGLPGEGSAHDPESMLAAGFASRMAGINQAATAAGALGEQQAEAIKNNVKAQEDAKLAYKDSYGALEKERQDHIADIKEGYIDPNKYWTGDKNGNGGHSKIAAGIGMILAGFNPTNSPNAAVNFLRFQMEQNLNAQKENLGAKQNLLTANLRQFGNMKDAVEMTRIMQHDIMVNELQMAAAKAQTPIAKAASLQAAGALEMEAAPMFQQFAMRRAMVNLAQNGGEPKAVEHMLGYMRVVNPDMAKEMESRFIPGVGLATVPISEAVRSEMVNKQKLNDAGIDLLNYSQSHSNLIPGTPEYNFGVSKSMAFQQQIREGLLGTVFRESEKPLLEKFVNENPAGALKMLSTQPKIKSILQSNELGLNTLKKSYGLPVKQVTPEPQIKTVNGVKYMRGPNGEAIRVK